MNFTYRKNDNSLLFKNIEDKDLLNIEKTQNYIPIYKSFFDLTEKNYNNINLNNYYFLKNIINKITDNIYEGIVINDKSIEYKKEIFFKYSPILDPIKFITNNYDLSHSDLLNIPQYNIEENISKNMYNYNNSAYIDSFFYYLTSQLLHNNNFLNAADFYGSFLGIKKNFYFNIIDDIENLYESEMFHKNKNKLFEITNDYYLHVLNNDSRNNKLPLKIGNNINDQNILNLSDISNISDINNLFIKNDLSSNTLTPNILYENNLTNLKKSNKTNETGSSCSSRSSNTNNSVSYSQDDNSESDDDNESNDLSVSDSTIFEDDIFINLFKFPIQLIALEKCENTLDSLFNNNIQITEEELGAFISQIILILITYQKLFSFTHNDLHSNNIMYVETEKQYLYYKYNSKYYKIPTFGKIFKIIDFGRAIYKFKGITLCSDSYDFKGDAATLYNFEPYFNNKKSRLEPNFSFDLSRLGCSLYDYFIDDLDDIKNIKSPIIKIIIDWCFDDKNRNILYKNNGEERYPDFKLYKMIARTVTKHKPDMVLNNEFFNQYIISKKKINNKIRFFNIDDTKI
tara:strand:+ start:1253 stop:2965 length:1713 start_codon:yes stop_codon:yes gene_type:complete